MTGTISMPRALGLALLLLAVDSGLARGEEAPELRAVVLPTVARGRGVGESKPWDAWIGEHMADRGLAMVTFTPSSEELKCMSTDCLDRIRRRLHADVAMRVQVTGGDFGFKLKLLLVRDGEAHKSSEESDCAKCSVEAARDQVDKAIARWLETTRPVLAASTDDGSQRGFEATRTGATGPTGANRRDKKRPGWLLGAEIALGAGVALGAAGVGLGIYALTEDGKPGCQLAAGQRQCPTVVDGGASAALWLGVGGAVLIGSAVVLAVVELRQRRAERPAHVTLAPLVWPGGGALSVGGAF